MGMRRPRCLIELRAVALQQLHQAERFAGTDGLVAGGLFARREIGFKVGAGRRESPLQDGGQLLGTYLLSAHSRQPKGVAAKAFKAMPGPQWMNAPPMNDPMAPTQLKLGYGLTGWQ